MKKILVVLAAGIGSRFGGGIKQLEPIDDRGHLIIDYSVHDAIEAGFRKIIFVIRRDIEADFRSRIGDRIEKAAASLDVEIGYAFQALSDIPPCPEEVKRSFAARVRPWGTGHAILCAADQLDGPFSVINSDDYYGKDGFLQASRFLGKGYALVGYVLKNTLSEHGGVTRGICTVANGDLAGVRETANIIKTEDGAAADGKPLDEESLVSMNFWCFPREFPDVLRSGFPRFLNSLRDPLRDEYLLPTIADGLLKQGVKFHVLPTADQWFGVTYRADQPGVVENFRRLYEEGIYPADLYSDLRRE